MKGVKTHRGSGKAGAFRYPFAEANGKREPHEKDTSFIIIMLFV